MPDRDPCPTCTATALAEAVEFAKAHGVESPINPSDFAVSHHDRRTVANYIDGDHAVFAEIDDYGHATYGIASLSWIHHGGDEDRLPCVDYCGECPRCGQKPCQCEQSAVLR